VPMTKRKPDSVGVILREEFLEPYHLTQEALADAMGVSRTFVNELVNDRRGITVDRAIMLAKAFNTSPQFWLNLYMDSQLWDTLHNPRKQARFKKILSFRKIVSKKPIPQKRASAA
jgi:antitoxin HigA-1